MTQTLDLAALGSPSPSAPAILRPDNGAVCYGQLARLVAAGQRLLERPSKALVAVDAPRTLTGLVAYLSALRSGHAVLLVENGSARLWSHLIATYGPELLVAPPGSVVAHLAGARGSHALSPHAELPVWRKEDDDGSATMIHPDLAMLIRTSGSLGPAKSVRLSFANLRANAMAIADALRIRRADRALTSLPLDFSFGLSILNSHLAAGAATGLTSAAPATEELWWSADQVQATCVGAVPATYHLLRAARWSPRDHPSLRRLLQAGGALDPSSLLHFAGLMTAVGGDVVAMYGQTEATARMTYLPPELLTERPGSVGVAIPGGKIRIQRQDGSTAGDAEIGEVVYQGPNVMMGYAHARTDLGAGDTQHGVLRTGDLGRLKDGFLYLAGRADRQVKILGRRVDLEQVELLLASHGVTAAAATDASERILVVVEKAAQHQAAMQCGAIAARLGLVRSSLVVIPVGAIPRTPNGKADHGAVRRELRQSTRIRRAASIDEGTP